MKRQRHAAAGSGGMPARPDNAALQAAPAKRASDDAPRAAEAGPDARVWAKYIDSRLKQFGTR